MSELISIKMIVVGNGTVGKSSMSQRFAKGSYTDEYKKTLGVDFLMKRKEVANTDVEYMIWDTAVQEYYDSITKRYYKGAHAAILVFAVDNRESFEAIPRWRDKVVAECGKIPMVLVRNKIDLKTVLVSEEEGSEMAERLKIHLFNVSVKDNIFVNNVFDSLALKLVHQARENAILDKEVGDSTNQFNSNVIQLNKGKDFNLTAKNIVKSQGDEPSPKNKINLEKKDQKKKKSFC